MLLVPTAALAELLELETAGGRLLVLGGCVVALFALSALQCYDLSHFRILSDSVRRCSAPAFLKFLPESSAARDLYLSTTDP
jgi:hypothetical protein